MKKSITLLGIACLVLSFIILPFIGDCKTEASEVIELKFGFHSPPPSGHTTDILEPYARLIEEATNNRIKVTTYPGATLFPPKNAYDAITSNIADMGWVFPGINPGRFPLQEVLSLPFIGKMDELEASLLHQHLYDTIPEFKSQFSDVKILAMFCDNASPIGSRDKPIRTIEDLKGMKIRVPGGPPSEWFKAAGATPMLVGPADIYSNMEKGVIDGWNIAWAGAAAYKLQEVTKYYTDSKAFYTPHFVAMNLQTWNSLPPDVQKALEKSAIGEPGARFLGERSYSVKLKDVQKVKDAGREIIELSPEESAHGAELAQPIVSAFVAKLEAKGLPGTKVLDEIVKFMKEYKD